MLYVLLAEHSAEVCPTGNAKTKALMLEVGPQIPKLAEKHGISIVAGPFVNHEHIAVMIAETDRAENLDAFLTETRLPQWNRVRVLPSQPIAEGMEEVGESTSLF
jgi:hypothetical protein